MSPKVDGVACSLRYVQGRLKVAATRGSGSVGEDITQNVLNHRCATSLAESSDGIEVRGEVYLPVSAFERVKHELANPRSTTAGALKQKRAGRAKELGIRFMAYDVFGTPAETEMDKLRYASDWGFNAVEQTLNHGSQVQAGYEAYSLGEPVLTKIDGIVFKANRLSEHA